MRHLASCRIPWVHIATIPALVQPPATLVLHGCGQCLAYPQLSFCVYHYGLSDQDILNDKSAQKLKCKQNTVIASRKPHDQYRCIDRSILVLPVDARIRSNFNLLQLIRCARLFNANDDLLHLLDNGQRRAIERLRLPHCNFRKREANATAEAKEPFKHVL